jgi:hypothetical protein
MSQRTSFFNLNAQLCTVLRETNSLSFRVWVKLYAENFKGTLNTLPSVVCCV